MRAPHAPDPNVFLCTPHSSCYRQQHDLLHRVRTAFMFPLDGTSKWQRGPTQPTWRPSHKAALCKNHLLCQQLLTKQYRRMGTHPRSWITTRRFKQEESGGSLEECLPGVRFPQIWTTEQPCPVRRKARHFLFVSSGWAVPFLVIVGATLSLPVHSRKKANVAQAMQEH